MERSGGCFKHKQDRKWFPREVIIKIKTLRLLLVLIPFILIVYTKMMTAIICIKL